ncbi:putative fatty acyl-CoA reductase CG5065 [Ixodes scapularis]|uniref:putative fatty acyl-CoA reductase CG5065 n=1 Tax=Ixodes scapularis TaxID=6945 RepID=UPI001A9F2E78|nr:putative fatty acyl-CoA reductase CG5065 [Ixodes scapularis]
MPELTTVHSTYVNNVRLIHFVCWMAGEFKYSEVQSFYQDEVIFITGATGFLGKALLEKLLRSCPGIRRIYILIRPKKNASPTGRLEVLLKSECFKRLHKEYPESLNKVVGVEGNLTDEKLGLKSSDYKSLASEVSVVFHCAATVRFNDTLRNAVKINMEGTKSVLELCHNMKNMKAVVHVSTAFVNCDHETLDERLYPPMVKPDDIIALTKKMDEVDLVKLTPELLGAKPNTYIFTKHLAEWIVAEHGQRLPLVIVRPSIVSASWREPVTGWLDGLQGVNLLVASGVTGVVTTIVADKSAVMDIIPVDVVANALIIAACQATLRGRTSQAQSRQDLPVYNCTSGAINKITYGEIAVLTTKLGRKHTPETNFCRPGMDMTMSPFYQAVAVFLFNYLPALFFDLVQPRRKQNMRMVDILKKYQYFFFTTRFFTTRNWKFNSEKFIELHTHNTPLDRKVNCI